MGVRTTLLPLLLAGSMPGVGVADGMPMPSPLDETRFDVVVSELDDLPAFDATFYDLALDDGLGVAISTDARASVPVEPTRTVEFHSLASGESVTVSAEAIRSAIHAYREALGDTDALLARSMEGERWHLADVHLVDASLMDGAQALPPLSRVRLPALEFERRTHLSAATSMLYVDFRLRHVLPEDLADGERSEVDTLAALDEMERLSSLAIGTGGVRFAAAE